jgi:23S rRNA (adenine2503-C2)-methyltransferase
MVFIKKEFFVENRSLINKKLISELDYEHLVLWLNNHNYPTFHAAQILKWIYLKLISEYSDMTDLPLKLRLSLDSSFYLWGTDLQQTHTDSTNVKKFVFSLNDSHFIETIFIPKDNEYTLCISSQVGCALGCRFCATGAMGIIRNLTAGEIVSQVLHVRKLTGSDTHGNIVFMGMGEPLLNTGAVVEAIKKMTDPRCMGWSPRRITVSTAGIVPEIFRLGKADLGVNLAVSLNAADDATRSRLMPINKKYPLKTLVSALNDYPLPSRQHRITCEYVMIQGVNDSPVQADKLVRLLNRRRYKINLIPYNATSQARFKSPDPDAILEFQNRLQSAGYVVRIRNSRGSGIHAACGQLAGFSRSDQS